MEFPDKIGRFGAGVFIERAGKRFARIETKIPGKRLNGKFPVHRIGFQGIYSIFYAQPVNVMRK